VRDNCGAIGLGGVGQQDDEFGSAESGHRGRFARAAFQCFGYTITASMGTKTFDTQPDSAENALRQVDDALYAAKAGGRNRCVNR